MCGYQRNVCWVMNIISQGALHKQLLAGAEAEGVDRAHLPHLTTYTVSYLVGNQEIFSFILSYSPETKGDSPRTGNGLRP